MELDYRIAEVLKVMERLDQIAQKTNLPRLEAAAVEEGIRLSGLVCAQEKYVFATPLMKNLMVVLGDVHQSKNDKGEYETSKLEAGKDSKAVKFINDVVYACLRRYNGPEVTEYSVDAPIDSVDLYNTDCWLGWKPGIWDIVPGMEEALRKEFPTYNTRKTNFGLSEMIKAVQTDTSLQKAILVMLEELPETKASGKVLEISDAFMAKKTGVSYPFYRNDSTKVPGKNKTYGRYCIELVERAYSTGGIKGLEEIAYGNNVYTGYTRKQRGKARPLRAESRISNLVVNMINGPEMENWKNSNLGLGFFSYDELKKRLIEMAEFVLNNPSYTIVNKDFTSYDKTVGYGWQCLQNALRYMKANGNLSKKLVEIRHVCGTKAMFVDGVNKRTYPIYGRQMSGYNDTTLGNTTISSLLTNAANIKTDPSYTSNVLYPMKSRNRGTLGDDIITIVLKSEVTPWAEYCNSFGFELHTDGKDAVGPMFLQYRLFKLDGEWVMGYNWPRVLRSMLSKESAKGLGPAGWTLSMYQQLEKCVEIPTSLKILVSIAAALDKNRLMLDVPIDKIKQMVTEEDNAKLALEKNKSKFLTTADRLASNPQFERDFSSHSMTHNDNNVINYDHFGDLQKKFREVYDPNFLPSLGFQNPDLTKVH